MAPAPGTPYPSSRARTVSPGPAAATSDDPLAVTDEEARIHVVDAEWRRAVMESIRDGMILFDSEGLVVEMNQAFADLFGYGLDDGPFRPPYPWWPTEEEDPDALREIRCFYEEVLTGEASEREFTFYGRDRRPVWVHSSGTAIHHASLGTTHLRVVHDITREREAQRRRAAAADVSQAFAVVDDLADLIGVAEHGFGLLFDGECTIQLGEGEASHWFNTTEPVDPDSLLLPVRVGLAGEPSPDTVSLRPGILLVPRAPGVPCRAWVQFPRPRRIAVEEMIAADLLAAGFAAALERLSAQQEASDRLANLRVAVESHRLVGQATGILVERHRILPAEAFERLRRASQRRNVKVRDLAALVIESGMEPEDA